MVPYPGVQKMTVRYSKIVCDIRYFIQQLQVVPFGIVDRSGTMENFEQTGYTPHTEPFREIKRHREGFPRRLGLAVDFRLFKLPTRSTSD